MDVPQPQEEEDTLSVLLQERGYHTEAVLPYSDLDAFLEAKGVPREIRHLLAQDYVRLVRERITARDPSASGLCRLAARLMRQAAGWGSLAHVMDTDDLLWRDLFKRDFVRFGERAHEWTRNRRMPWKSAYLWTVFLRRRCLRAVARDLGEPERAGIKTIPFGEPGSVCVLEGWTMQPWWHDHVLREYYVVGWKSKRYLERYNVDDPRFDDPQFKTDFFEGRSAYTEDRRHGAVPDFVSFPCDLLMTSMTYAAQDEYVADLRVQRRPMRAIFASNLSTDAGTFARHVGWNYADAIYAYCSLGRLRGSWAHDPPGEEVQGIFDSLPDYPTVRGKLFLGTQVK